MFCPLYAAFGPEPIRVRLNLSGARVLVTTEALYRRKIQPQLDALPALEYVLISPSSQDSGSDPRCRDLSRLIDEADPKFQIEPTDPEDRALLHFTSGTTGTPKGVVHVHHAVLMHSVSGKLALDIHPGDVILHNDVFTGGNQNADVATFKPIFSSGELFAWAAVKGHQADIGGAVAGGYNPDAREVWQEALRIPPVKVVEKGKLRQDVWDLIFANIRYPIVKEDIKAQIGACTVGEKQVHSLIERYGLEALREQKTLLFDSTEQMVRSEIEQIPDGQYQGQSWMYYDGIHAGSRFRIKLTITVRNDEIYFDYTGTDDQTAGFANAPLGASMSAVILTFLMLIDPNIPHNEGLLKPLHVHIPEGTFLNARFPAATTFGNSITGPNADAILKAFSKAVPAKVTAG